MSATGQQSAPRVLLQQMPDGQQGLLAASAALLCLYTVFKQAAHAAAHKQQRLSIAHSYRWGTLADCILGSHNRSTDSLPARSTLPQVPLALQALRA